MIFYFHQPVNLLFLHGGRRIRIRIHISYLWIRNQIREAQKYVHPDSDPDPQHWYEFDILFSAAGQLEPDAACPPLSGPYPALHGGGKGRASAAPPHSAARARIHGQICRVLSRRWAVK
jgi:hypothetical protein